MDCDQMIVADPIRTLDQNALMWACLTDLSKQLMWPVDGVLQHLEPWEWKVVISAGLKKAQRVAAGIDGGFVMLGASTSRMKKSELSDLLEVMFAFGATKNIVWSDLPPQPQNYFATDD